MADPVTIGLIAATAISAGGQVYSGVKQGQAAEADAASKRAQADEVLVGANRDNQLELKQGQQLIGQQAAAYSAGGVDISGSPLMMLEQTNAQVQEEIVARNHAAQFRADQLRKGANVSSDLSSAYTASGILGATSTLIKGGARTYGLMDPNSASKISLLGGL